jgi:protein TonB
VAAFLAAALLLPALPRSSPQVILPPVTPPHELERVQLPDPARQPGRVAPVGPAPADPGEVVPVPVDPALPRSPYVEPVAPGYDVLGKGTGHDTGSSIPRDGGSWPAPDAYVWVEELPEPIEQPRPRYPGIAEQAGVDGVVRLRVLVDAGGGVREVLVTRSVPMLDSAAIEAVRHWTFRPGLAAGRPVACWVEVSIRFVLR